MSLYFDNFSQSTYDIIVIYHCCLKTMCNYLFISHAIYCCTVSRFSHAVDQFSYCVWHLRPKSYFWRFLTLYTVRHLYHLRVILFWHAHIFFWIYMPLQWLWTYINNVVVKLCIIIFSIPICMYLCFEGLIFKILIIKLARTTYIIRIIIYNL
jgi:hypothetical protein